MDLKKFQFPDVSDADIAFPTFKAIPQLVNEAKLRGFYEGRGDYNRLFAKLFFDGGSLNFKADLPDDFKVRATRYLRAFMRSFAPKHEEKEAVCALILSELVDII